ncbi:serine/threonine protein kinase [Arthrobacter pascens]|uniref:serine/threonine-protein kinase n=1 Tax=Arthrobacter pascens TaxID=1677 RepID=UPI00285F1C6A|nr:serine/threonine-protein kinase [Arthrobacter pascens]MDR6559074.1 serine/threonine protein kinase [Arthrobacter pascens]
MDDVSQDTDHSGEREPQVPGYRVCRRLGSGGSAVVWLVTEEASGRKLALKCFGTASGTGPGSGAVQHAEEDIRREILIMSVLDHGHLVKSHDVVTLDGVTIGGATENVVGILMDYAPGGSLRQLVGARGRLSVGETVTVLTPIAQALAYLHGRGFTHSDVSPGNVLFSGHGKPLLADLGLARMVGDPAGVSELGTDGFRDPSPVDALRAGLQPGRDVYAAAALGWYCLTGAPPLPAPDRPPLSLLVPGVPHDLAAALEAGLSEDRRQRPDAAELATAIYRSAGALPVDLSRSVHPTVLPELLTRKPEQPARGRMRERLGAWGRRLRTSAPAAAFRKRPGTSEEPLGGRLSAGSLASAPDGMLPGRHGRHARSDRGAPLSGQRRLSRRAAAAPRRRRAAWAGLLAAPVIAGAWLLPTAPPSDPLPGGTGTGPSLVRDGSPAPAPAATPAPVATTAGIPAAVRSQLRAGNPVEAVKGLAWLRSTAFSEGRLELLAEVNAPNSPAAAADRRISVRLRDSRTVLAGFTTSLARIRSLPESTGARAVVAVTAATSGYVERSAAGAVVATGLPQPSLDLRLVLLRIDGRWLISEILPAP